MRLACQPAPIHLAVGRQVINALHICQTLAFLPGVVVVHALRPSTHSLPAHDTEM